MKKMRERVLALVLTLALAMSLLPVGGVAADPPSPKAEHVESLTRSKTITKVSDNRYNIELKFTAKDMLSETSAGENINLMFVLDITASMLTEFGTSTRLKTMLDSIYTLLDTVPNSSRSNLAVVTYTYYGTHLVKWTDWKPMNETGKQEIKTFLSEIKAVGNTYYREGMKRAQTQFNLVSRNGNKNAMVFFTDGEPSMFSDVKLTLDPASSIKNAGIEIYTVALLDGADSSAPVADTVAIPMSLLNATDTYRNGLMHAISSNYPSSSATDTLITMGPGSNQGYYKEGNDPNKLNAAFQDIGREVVVTEPLSNVTVTDTMSQYVDLVGDSTNVTVTGSQSTLTRGTDYTVTSVNGKVSVKFLKDLSDGETFTITIPVAVNEAARQYRINNNGAYPNGADGNGAGFFSNSAATLEVGDVSVNFKEKPVVEYAWGDHTVTFDSNGGSAVTPQTVTIKDNTSVTKPADPNWPGHTFAGWYTEKNGGTLYDFSSRVHSSMTLYAHWTQNQVEVRFDAREGTPVPETQTLAQYGVATKPPTDPQRTGYTFAGWYTEAEGGSLYGFNKPVAQSMTLYARWTQNQVQVRFDAKGGAPTPAMQTIAQFGTATEPAAAPIRPGFTFAGWYTTDGGDELYDFSQPVAQNMTLYARWTQNKFWVNFHGNEGTPELTRQEVAELGTATVPEQPTRTGYTFAGWYTAASDGERYDFSTQVTRDLNLYAQWTQNTYQVTFDPNGGAPVPAAQTVAEFGTATVPEPPSRAGYTFSGWYTEADGGSLYDFSAQVTGPLTLYAHWVRNTCTVEFKTYGGSTVPSQTVYEGDPAVRPPEDPTRQGYTFLGWYTQESGGGAYDFSSPVTQNLTLHAQWKEKRYDVIFDSNGGSEIPGQNLPEGAMAARPAEDPVLPGYDFLGWFTGKDDGEEYGFSTPVTGNLTLYAHWKETEKPVYTVTFQSGNEKGDTSSETVTEGETAQRPLNPAWEGYAFQGWFTEETGGTLYDFDTPVAGDLTLYGQWKQLPPDTVTVTFEPNFPKGPQAEVQTVVKGGTVTAADVPQREGYTFRGWSLQAEGKRLYDFSSPVTGDLILYAQWEKNYYTVTYDLNYPEAPQAETKTVGYRETAPQPAEPFREGYSISGWYTEAKGGEPYDFGTPVTGNLTIYAQWDAIMPEPPVVYGVEFNLNYPDAPAPESVSVEEGQAVAAPENPLRPGYEFRGWFTAAEDGEPYVFGTAVTGNLILYAHWAEILPEPIPTHRVTYDLNYPTSPTPTVVTVDEGAPTPRPGDPQRQFYQFGGWSLLPEGGELYDFSTPVTEDLTLYAQWTYVPIFRPGGHSPVKPVLNTEEHRAYIVGYSDETVRPNGNITRAEVATIFFRLLTDDCRLALWSRENIYADVAETKWYNNPISTLSNGGILHGFPDGNFYPNEFITRAQFAAIAARFLDDPLISREISFNDVSGRHWAAKDIQTAVDAGLIDGYPGGTFQPDKPITRAESIVIINRLLGRHPHRDHLMEDMQTWVDNSNPNAWYYADVQEATNSHDCTFFTENDTTYEEWTELLPNLNWTNLELVEADGRVSSMFALLAQEILESLKDS